MVLKFCLLLNRLLLQHKIIDLDWGGVKCFPIPPLPAIKFTFRDLCLKCICKIYFSMGFNFQSNNRFICG